MIYPLIIGQAPARGNDELPPFSGPSGARLARLAGVGFSGDELPKHFDLENLISKYPGKAGTGKGDRFDLAAAKIQAAILLEAIQRMEARHVLFMGRGVAKCFGFGGRSYLRPWTWNQHIFVIFPHPSGVNRWWNDQNNERRAQELLRSILNATHQGSAHSS